MKRFYKQVTVAPEGPGFALRLDERGVKTPARAGLVVPSAALADAIAQEWQAQGEEIDPRTMPLTGLANAAIDRVAPDAQAFAARLAEYAESDLLCYRAENPDTLVARQAERWDPILAWARQRFDIELAVVCGIMHRKQSDAAVQQLARAVAARDPFELAGLSPLVTVSGSLVIALALAEGAIDLDQAWDAASLDEKWQLEQWGEDAEASAALDARRRDFKAGARFLELLR
ncbi:MAG: ATP12 family chaperone protein [Allosphingosinicella sp.]|uniref:ATP12 family chaperone protein n=1 Tax=Allosphingosinicella sp. TaxID=2823234 RepID=UPI0039429222